jgi:nucleoside permease NupC
VGALLGERVVLNEFLAYLHLGFEANRRISPRSAEIATYALCGFANFGSIAIQIGGIGALVPQRRAELAKIGLKSMLGGLLACYCTACVAGPQTPAFGKAGDATRSCARKSVARLRGVDRDSASSLSVERGA